MAWIEERTSKQGDVTYTVTIRLKGHPTRTASFKRKTDAKRWAEQTESAIREGRHFKAIESRKRTLSDLIEKYKRAEIARHRVDATKVFTHLNYWEKHLGAYLLGDVSHIRINEVKEELRNTPTKSGKYRSDHTIRRYIASLSVCFSYGVKELGWLDENPVLKVRKPKEPRGRVRFLSEDERNRLLQAAFADLCKEIYPIIVLALGTGMRLSEITHLKWSHIDFKHKRIILDKTKNGEYRTVPLASHLFQLISELNKVRRINSVFVFPQATTNKPINPRKAWNRVVSKSGLEDLRFHDLRHTAASYLAMNGATLLEIATILGHKTIAMVKRYAHLTDQHTASVLERMNQQQFCSTRN